MARAVGAIAVALAAIVMCSGSADAASLRRSGSSKSALHPKLQHMLDNLGDEDTVEVFKVENPLSRAKYGDLLGNLDLYHTGLLLWNRRQNQNLTFEFTAKSFGAFFPVVTADNKLQWNDGGFVVPPHEDEDWERQTYVAELTADAFRGYSDWVADFNRTHTEYLLFALMNGEDGTLSHSSQTCYDFGQQSLEYLFLQSHQQGSGVRMMVDGFWRDDVEVYGGNIHEVDPRDPDAHARIVAFYSALQGLDVRADNIKDKLTEAVAKVLAQIGGFAYIKTNNTADGMGQYVGFSPVKPYFNVGYHYHQLV